MICCQTSSSREDGLEFDPEDEALILSRRWPGTARARANFVYMEGTLHESSGKREKYKAQTHTERQVVQIVL